MLLSLPKDPEYLPLLALSGTTSADDTMNFIQFIPVGNALRVGDEARIGRQVGGSHNLAQPRELPVVSYGERENAVAGVESFVGRDRRMPITERARRVARREEPRGLVHQRREQAREKSDLDVLPEPAPGTLVQGSEDGDRGILSLDPPMSRGCAGAA